MKNDVEQITNTLFNKLNINTDLIEITNINDTNIFNIKIESKESWLLIWNNWRTFDSLQNILKLMCSRKIWEKIKLHLEINNYVKTKDDRLLDFINNKIINLEKNWKDIILPYYSSYERKKIHWFISSMKNRWIFTKSIWEWKERRLHIYKQKPKLTIDIDWNDI